MPTQEQLLQIIGLQTVQIEILKAQLQAAQAKPAEPPKE